MVLDAIAERRGSPLYGNITIGALIAAIAASVLAYSDPGPAFSDMLHGRRLRHLLPHSGHRRRDPGGALVVPLSHTRERRTGRVSRADAVLRGGTVRHGRGQRADHDLHRPGDLVDRHLRARRLPARRQAQQRSGAEILPAGIFRHRVLPLRRRADLRHDRHDQPRL